MSCYFKFLLDYDILRRKILVILTLHCKKSNATLKRICLQCEEATPCENWWRWEFLNEKGHKLGKQEEMPSKDLLCQCLETWFVKRHIDMIILWASNKKIYIYTWKKL